MAADRTVKVTLKAVIDDYMSKMKQASAGTEDFAKNTQRTAKDHRQAWDNVGKGMMVTGGLIAAGLGLAVAKFADFDQAMSAVAASTMASGDELGSLRDIAMKMGADTQYSATEAAQGINEMAKAGVRTKDIIGGGLKGALDLAAASGMDVGRAAEIAATALNQFGLEGKDLPHVADLFAAAAGKAQGSAEDIAQAMKYVGPVAKGLGISIEETTGVIAEFASKGIVGEQAGSSFRGMLLSLTSPSALAAKTLDQLGISLYDGRGKFIGMAGVAGQLQAKLGGLDEATRNQALGQIFGNEQITAATILMQGGAGAVQDWTKAVSDAGFASDQAAKLTDNLRGDLERLGGSLDTALIQTGSGANDALRSLTQSLDGVIKTFAGLPGPTQEAVVKVGAVGAAALVAGGALVVAVPKVVAFREALTTLGVAGTRASAALGALGMAAGVAVTAVAAAEVRDMAAAAKVGTPAVNDLARSLTAVAGGAKDAGAFSALFANHFNDFSQASDAIRDFGANAKAALAPEWYERATGTAGEALAVFKTRVQSIDQALAAMVQAGNGDAAAKVVDQLAQSTVQFGGDAEKVKEQFAGYNAAVAASGPAAASASPATQTLATALGDAGTKAKSAADATKEWADQVKGVNSPALDAEAAARAWEASIDAADAALKENGKTLDITNEKGRQNKDALDGMAQAALGQIGAMQANGASQEQMRGQLEASKQRLEETAQRFGMTREEARAYADKVLQIPPAVKTTVELNAEAAMARVEAFKVALNGLKDRTVTVNYQTYGPGLYAGKPAPMASGGYVRGPGTPTSDSIPARLSDGEYVVQASAVAKYGTAFFDAVNARRFADGGYVGRAVAPAPAAAPPPSAVEQHNNYYGITDPERLSARVRGDLAWALMTA